MNATGSQTYFELAQMFIASYFISYSAGFIASASAAGTVTIALSEHIQVLLRRTGVLKVELFFKVPTMLATAPLILGMKKAFWHEQGFIVRLDWSYSGRTAIDSLVKDKEKSGLKKAVTDGLPRIDVVVSTDFALMHCLAREHMKRGSGGFERGLTWILPFAVIKNPIFEAYPKDLPPEERKFCYNPGSIQEDYIRFQSDYSPDQLATKVRNLEEGLYHSISNTNDSNAYLLWEPYNISHEKISDDFCVMQRDDIEHEVVLCLVHEKSEDRDTYDKLKSVFDVIKQCCDESPEDRSDLENLIRDYFPEHAMGVDFDDSPSSGGAEYHFGVNYALQVFAKRAA